MRIWRVPDQVFRLAILFAAFLLLFVAIRRQFIPETFGDVGHYRAVVPDIVAAQPIRYAGWETCVECHEEEGRAKNRSYHRTVACEVCHGPSADHAEDPGSRLPDIPRGRDACLYCHGYLPSRATGFPQVIEMLHNPVKPCIACHDAHDPTPPEIPGACSACHTQIARTMSISHHASLTCETCHETPPEHREVPRTHLPKKPTSREFCGTCHARGSLSGREIPKVDFNTHGGTYMCWQCHYPHFPEGS